MALVLAESLLVCLAAALLGLAAASAIYPELRIDINGITPPLQPGVIYRGVALAVALALVSGLPPGWRAKRLVIVDALALR
jgi:putative ABC transport system permease protein